MIIARMKSHRLKQYAQGLPGLHQVLILCIRASSLVFLGDLSVDKQVDLWFLCPLFGSFSSFGLSCPTQKWYVFVLFYYVLLCCILLLSLRSLLFSNIRDKNEVDLDGKGDEGDWGKWRGSSNKGILCEKNYLFSIKRNSVLLELHHGVLKR